MWRPDKPNAGLGRIYALESIIKQAIPDLNLAFQNAPLYAPEVFYLSQEYGAIVPDTCVKKGDLEKLPDMGKYGWLHIRIVTGMAQREGMDVQSSRVYIQGNTRDEFFTAVYAYLHPDAFLSDAEDYQQTTRLIAQEIISDWLRARVLNFVGVLPDNSGFVDYRTLTLPSRERVADLDGNGNPQWDQLSDCKAIFGNKGYFTKDFGDEVAYGIMFVHSGLLQG